MALQWALVESAGNEPTRSSVALTMLSIVEGRIIGALLEKQRTTPDQYPLSLNALVLACNQATSREPVMALPSDEVELALNGLKGTGWLRFVHPTHGRSVTRFRQIADEKLAVTDPAPAAIVTLLLLRGPQTAGELRTRSERLHGFDNVEQVESALRALAEREDPLVQLLERQPGQKEQRWQQLVAEEAEATTVAAPALAAPSGGLADRLARLEARVAFLEAQLGVELEREADSGSGSEVDSDSRDAHRSLDEG